ncbi:PREDICTED: uclacyanin-3-like [Ipomoea nil]|uniref:uclacyanin-3-like n=1 Tax=Ipomoea nil TaxID=35883 RepID=UPI000901BCCD|nr:PREDICTED: uclacyanin-3-like [Ipomoea nil]
MDSKIIFFSVILLFSSGAAMNITTTVTLPLVNHNSAKTNSVLATSPVPSPSSPTNAPPANPTPTNAPPATPTSTPPASPNGAAPTSPKGGAPTSPSTNPPQPAGPITPGAAPSPRKMLSPPLPPNIITPAASPAPTEDDSSVGRSLRVSAGAIVATIVSSNLFLMLMA